MTARRTTSGPRRESVARRAAAARGYVATGPRVERSSPACSVERDAVRHFTAQVALATAGPCFRYSQRLQLLALAGRAGISRFDANLIIAAIEHRAGASASRETIDSSPRSPRRRSAVLAAISLQGLILATGWFTLFA